MPRRPALLLALAIAVRAVACAFAPLPARDGAAYLWMAREFAHGNADELCAHVFHPLYPLLVGIVLRAVPSLDVVVAGQLVASACSALTVLPLWAITKQRFGDAAATWACTCFALSAWFARHPAECMSEGTFQLAAAAWVAALFAAVPRPLLAGLAAGAAFLVRPEGAAFVLVGTVVAARAQSPRTAWRHAIAGVVVAGLLPLAYFASGRGFVLTPKLAFNWEVGAGHAESPVAHYLHHFVDMPGDAFEGLGYVTFPLALLGLWLQRRTLRAVDAALLVPFAMVCAVIPLLRSNLRFFAGTGVLLLPFAGAACAALARRRAHAVWLVLLLVASEAKLCFGDRADRTAERDVGRWLATQLHDGETLASDMPRLWFYAGRRPPPPRKITAADLLAWAADPHCRFVVWKQGRSAVDTAALQRAGFAAIELPAEVAAMPGVGEVHTWERSR